MKKFITTIAALNIAVAATAMLGSSAVEARELRFVHGYPTASQHQRNVEWFTEQVTERTGGKVTFKIFPAAQLMPINQELPAIFSGQVSMTYSVAPVVASVEPLWGIFDLPFLFDVKTDNMELATKFFHSKDGGGKLGELMEKRGFKLITIAPTDYPSSIYLTAPKAVTKQEDLKGLKIRNTGGEVAQKTGEIFGYSPIAVAGAELVPALSQGMVDGGILPPLYAYDNKLPVKGISIAPFSWPAVTPIIMSLKEFKALTPDQQDIMMQTGLDLQKRSQKIVEESTVKAIQLLKDGGADVAILSDEEVVKWRKNAQPVWDLFIKKYGADAQAMVNVATKLREEQAK
ncbi:TRAP transporter substrate-binding protein DctP [Alcaligenaceae bacterium]|nr:TRAP transporter substrate-binding protein DctP [Alcaligenaceae bacterium]